MLPGRQTGIRLADAGQMAEAEQALALVQSRVKLGDLKTRGVQPNRTEVSALFRPEEDEDSSLLILHKLDGDEAALANRFQLVAMLMQRGTDCGAMLVTRSLLEWRSTNLVLCA